MTEYTAGFMFSEDHKRVALIVKNRPEWQAGLANGIGGHLKPNESPFNGMVREFEEETGCLHKDWSPFISLVVIGQGGEKDGAIVHFFQTTGDLTKLKTVTDEGIVTCQVDRLPHNIVPNLLWLIPLAALQEVTGTLTQRMTDASAG
jgi:8-oxo-dGTP pyrophosphatase MutT (NUDIX family)